MGPTSYQYRCSCLPTRSGSGQRGRVPELYPSFRPMPRVYLRGRKLRCWACSLEPKPYRSLHNSSNGWPDLHSNNGGGSFAAMRARLSLSLTGRFRNFSRRFMWIGFSWLLIMTAHVRDTPSKGRTRKANCNGRNSYTQPHKMGLGVG